MAAQHGHTGALTTLLAHGANPNMENTRGEKVGHHSFSNYSNSFSPNLFQQPLDLAAQYGRLQVVQMLVRAHPELLLPYKKPGNHIWQHTPLHLASRNGHKHVVEVLLAAGVYVSTGLLQKICYKIDQKKKKKMNNTFEIILGESCYTQW